MLSKKNKARLNSFTLYEHEPEKRYRKSLMGDDLYWCCNWTFKVIENTNGEVYMCDTYWDNSRDGLWIEVTDQNIDEFTPVLNFTEVKEIREDEQFDYDEGVVITTAVGSGGWRYGKRYYVPKDHQKSKGTLIKKQEQEIEYIEIQLRCAKDRLVRLKNGEIC